MDFHQKCYVCVHVFARERPVLLVNRGSGDWCLACGQEHADTADEYRVVGIGHVIEWDPTLDAILDLPTEWEAERGGANGIWARRPLQGGNGPVQGADSANSKVLH
jgi:hypothetical protein